MVERGDARDIVDVAEALGRWTAAQLIAMARVADPHLEDHEFAALEIIRRNAHEVHHHLIDINRSVPSST